MATARTHPLSILSVVGARPQFIKAAVVSQAIDRLSARQRPRHRLIHTGQHFEVEMSDVFFRDLPLPTPAYSLGLGGTSPATQLGRMVEALDAIYQRERPDAVVVYGDTTSTLAGALAAALQQIPLAHVEAGLRSFNRRMSEETNRVLTDHLAAWLFCPTQTATKHLQAEGITRGVHVVGDVMVDALVQVRGSLKQQQGAILKKWGLTEREYYLATVHRAENTVEARGVIGLLQTFGMLDRPTILPLHPRTRNLLQRAGWRSSGQGRLRVVAPLSYPEMLVLERSSRAILTDSGGVQKEAYFWGVPCLTLRRETEWVETVEAGCNRLVGTDRDAILHALRSWRPSGVTPNGLFGNGRAAERIVAILRRRGSLQG
jgi:UDP-GlcNAc3NAcA epimerase